MREKALYLVMLALLLLGLLILDAAAYLPLLIRSHHRLFLCGIAGGIGGVVYCLRAIYLNGCVLRQWDEAWAHWYFIRPIVSAMCGCVSYVFLQAGLLVLDAQARSDASQTGFLALAFIAGLNVDKFISKIEDIAQATWGIEKTRIGKRGDE